VKKKQQLFKWVKILIVLYCLVGIAGYFLQEKLLFRAVKLSPDSSYHFPAAFKELTLAMDASTSLNMVQFTVADSLKKGLVLYFHGNRQNISHYAAFAQNFTRNHYEVWMPDYPGFGKSTGEMSEQLLYEQALQVYKLARTHYQPGQIIIYGKSIGTGIATELAAVRDCKSLVLETPHYGLVSLMNTFFWMYPVEKLLHYKFPIYQYITRVSAPITIFHGTDDGTIPYRNAHQLAPLLKPGDQFITIEKGTHNNLTGFSQYQTKLDSLLKH
jgi:pimeloyl-ACP methyl ester carboxylesterase